MWCDMHDAAMANTKAWFFYEIMDPNLIFKEQPNATKWKMAFHFIRRYTKYHVHSYIVKEKQHSIPLLCLLSNVNTLNLGHVGHQIEKIWILLVHLYCKHKDHKNLNAAMRLCSTSLRVDLFTSLRCVRVVASYKLWCSHIKINCLARENEWSFLL